VCRGEFLLPIFLMMPLLVFIVPIYLIVTLILIITEDVYNCT